VFGPGDKVRLISLAMITTRARAPVHRDSDRNIEGTPTAEYPTRVSESLSMLLAGLLGIGVEKEEAWEIVKKVALDTMPTIRRLALASVLKHSSNGNNVGGATVVEAMKLTRSSMQSTRRAFEDLKVHGVVQSEREGKADRYRLSEWGRGEWVGGFGKVEMPEWMDK